MWFVIADRRFDTVPTPTSRAVFRNARQVDVDGTSGGATPASRRRTTLGTDR
jgi:hypothetical protein